MITTTRPRAPGVDRRRGFTLIEVVAVMVIVGIMAASALPAMHRIGAARAKGAARSIQHDLAWARQHAVATGTTTWVAFDTAAESWTLLAEDPDGPGRAGATAMPDAASGSDWVERLGTGPFVDLAFATVSFDGGTEIGFDWLGRPYNASEMPLAAQGSVTVTDGYGVTIETGTGLPRFLQP